MKLYSLEAMILDLDTNDHGSSPRLAVLCDFCCCFSFCLFVFFVIFDVEKTCFIIIRALLSAFLNVRRLASICKYNSMK